MATFRPAGEEDDYDEDDFMLGNEDICVDDKPRILGPVPKNVNNNTTRRPVLNGFGAHNTSSVSGSGARTIEEFQAAAMKGHVDVIEDCLKQGLKVDEVLKCGWTALMYAGNCVHPNLVKFLLRKGADPNFHQDFYTVLHAACSSNRRDKSEAILECVTALVEAGADINVRDRYHTSPLMSAAREGHLAVVEYLLDHGVEMDRQDSQGSTALSWATTKGHLGVVKSLLAKGANPDLRDTNGDRAVDIARLASRDEIACFLEGKPYDPSASKPAVSMMNGSRDQPISPQKLPPHQSQNRKPPLPPDSDLIPSDRAIDQRHGELEVFLFGLDLGQLIPLFKDQHVDFFNFLRFNEQDLINMGITQIGIRKKILDATEIVHRKEWDTSSLISVQYNKHIGCPDAIAMVANISKHLCYIGSTVGYVSDQIITHPDILSDVRDGTGPRQLHKHTQDALKNVLALEKEIGRLKTRLTSEMKTLNIDPPDIIQKNSRPKSRRISRLLRLMTVSAIVTAAAVAWWKRGEIVEKGMAFFVKS